MFRFTIRDMLWLTVVVAMAVALGLEHRRFTTTNAALQAEQAERRMAELLAKELRGEVILPTNNEIRFKTLERRGWKRPELNDESTDNRP
jgi:hypothetical protein